MKIVIDKDIPFIEGRLEGDWDVVYCAGGDINHELVKDAEALIVRTRTRCNESLLKDSKVKFIGTATIGTDHIDMTWCKDNGITVSSAPGCNAPGVAQYVFSSLFLSGFDCSRHVLGIIGYGNVGGLVGKWASEMGITTLICDPPRAESGYDDPAYSSMEKVLKESDAITLHVPLTETGKYATRRLIMAKEMETMKKGAILINSSRGGVVDEEALKVRLMNKDLRAITDVWENEPQIDPSLLELSCIATPHIAGYSFEGKKRGTRMVLESLGNFFGFRINIDDLRESEDASSVKITKELIEKSYNPVSDSERLKKAPLSFEKFRNEYNFRHEPAYSILKI